MAKITKVPDGPLVKKKGAFKGSTLKTGGKIKKAQGGEFLTKEDGKYTSTKKVKTKNGPRYYQGKSPDMSFARELAFDKSLKISDSIPKAKLSARALEVMNQKNGGKIKKAQDGAMKKPWKQMSPTERAATQTEIKATRGREGFSKYMDSIRTDQFAEGAAKRGLTVDEYRKKQSKDSKKPDVGLDNLNTSNSSQKSSSRKAPCKGGFCTGLNIKSKNGSSIKKAKSGAMIKRADGSMSKPGLWDNIRKNKGSGKKPTAAMLKQERKIKKAQTGGSFGNVYTGPAKTNPGVLKAKADKAKANANLAAYKLKAKK